ncbi:hypothetical protein [Nostoc sp.]|uniref:hypothetical protein n=1 Tax=Nostoc sp. TaxID=1180 RepID=UPI002FF55EC9
MLHNPCRQFIVVKHWFFWRRSNLLNIAAVHKLYFKIPGLTQLAQAMVREAHRAPKNYTEDIAISGRFSC